ncbi:hybrid sensor histidine kinase/response regulator [Clostridia bacterium]|nr:hybrid sensor histidine kinase/response regulator [Clostridia bacterium]
MNKTSFRVMCVLLAIAITVTGAISVAEFVRSGRESAAQSLRRIEQNNESGAAIVRSWLDFQAAYVEAIAADMAYIPDFSDEQVMHPILKAHAVRRINPYSDVYIGYPDGTGAFSSDFVPDYTNWISYERLWYLGAVRNPEVHFISHPFADEMTNEVCLSISKAVVRDGSVIGVIAANIYVEAVSEIVNAINVGADEGYVFVTGRENVIIAHQREKYTPEERDVFHLLDEVEDGRYANLNLLEDGEKAVVMSADGVERYYVAHSIGDTSWRIYTAVPFSMIQQPDATMAHGAVILFIIVVCLIILLLFFAHLAVNLAEKTSAEESRTKFNFLTNISHEIKTPLNGIIGISELALGNGGLPQKHLDYMVKIKTGAMGVLDIINDILDLSKFEAGKIKLDRVPFSLHELFMNCETITGFNAAEKGVGLYFYSEPRIKKKALGDPSKLRRIILNLLSNALKFTNTGIVKFMVMIEGESDDYVDIRFEVKDSGIGMTEAQIEKIFKPFARAKEQMSRYRGGTGLGLPITKNLIELMGGTLVVESTVGIGSKFSFSLRFALSDEIDDSYENPVSTLPQQTTPAFKGLVLVCEDNEINQEVIAEHLRILQIKPIIVENGRRGVDAVLRCEEYDTPFDLILMDIHMPIMDGLEAAQELKRNNIKTPIVAMTANVMPQDMEIYRAHGMTEYLRKPFVAQELWTCLAKYLSPAEPEKPYTSAPPEFDEADFTSGIPSNAIIDEQSGIEMTGDLGLYKRIKRDFYAENLNFSRDLQAALNIGDTVTAHRMAHTLRGAARLIGAKKLFVKAYELEKVLANGFANFQTEQLSALNEILAETLEYIKNSTEGITNDE